MYLEINFQLLTDINYCDEKFVWLKSALHKIPPGPKLTNQRRAAGSCDQPPNIFSQSKVVVSLTWPVRSWDLLGCEWALSRATTIIITHTCVSSTFKMKIKIPKLAKRALSPDRKVKNNFKIFLKQFYIFNNPFQAVLCQVNNFWYFIILHLPFYRLLVEALNFNIESCV